MTDRTPARELARRHLEAGDPLGWFEPLYAAARGDAAAVPWADLRPNPALLDWLDRQGGSRGRSRGGAAAVVGCGLGDDAEALARRGFAVTAFDIAPTAVDWCGRRFPASAVEYVVADLLDPPADWRGRFDLVVESYTLQVMPPDARRRAMSRLAELLAPAAALLVICRGRDAADPEGEMPWPLTRDELTSFVTASGLVLESFGDFLDEETPPVRRFRAGFNRPALAAADDPR